MARFSAFLLILLMLWPALASAQAANSFEDKITSIETSVESVETGFQADMSEARVAELRTVLNNTDLDLETLEASISAALAKANSDLQDLGDAPAEGQEDPVANLRRSYGTDISKLTAQQAKTRALSQRIDKLQSETSEALREAFLTRVLKRERLPVFGEGLSDAIAGLRPRLDTLKTAFQPEPMLSQVGFWLRALVGLLLVCLPPFLFRDMLAGRVWDVVEIEGELAASRAVTALVRAVRRIAVAAFGLFVLYQVIGSVTQFDEALGNPLRGVLLAVLFVITANALSVAILSPRKSTWRLVRLNNADAMLTYRRLRIGFIFMGGYIAALALIGSGNMTGPLANSVKFVGLNLFGLYCFYMARQLKTSRWRLIGYCLAAFAIFSAWLGYFAIGDMVISLIANFAIFLAGLYVIRQFLRNWAALAVETMIAGKPEDLPEGAPKPASTKTGDAITFWTGVGVDALLLVAAIPVALALAGVPWSEIWALVRQALIGFEVFNIRITPIKVIYGLLIFIGLLLLTRVFQRTLNTRILPQAGIEPGLRNTLSTLFGYLGLILASLIGIQALGLDLGGLTIIAGALSVGIGFGLQSIVNNFVSGLILLLERPIKIDDWVVTNSGEGRVKRINVRSTEIETFDKCSIIVPNSELITSAVNNWTHKDRSARITVPVGVAYDSDPNQVRDILYSVLDEVKGLLRYPEPYVYFKDFGASSLDMELRVFVREANDIIRLRSELRYKIFAAFQREGIEIPFPQRDINFRNAMTMGRADDAAPETIDVAPESDAPIEESSENETADQKAEDANRPTGHYAAYRDNKQKPTE